MCRSAQTAHPETPFFRREGPRWLCWGMAASGEGDGMSDAEAEGYGAAAGHVGWLFDFMLQCLVPGASLDRQLGAISGVRLLQHSLFAGNCLAFRFSFQCQELGAQWLHQAEAAPKQKEEQKRCACGHKG